MVAFFSSGCVTVISTCWGALVGALGDGGCMRHVWYQMHVAAATTSRQPPSERPMARPRPASC
eukprot:scaffold13715_cov69-Phaeocystis_antarctica.AAC.3